MYWYSLVGLLATAVLIIQNYNILFTKDDRQNFPEIEIYRRFLYGIMSYYITDTLWGILDSLKLTSLLFLDTIVYYIAMAVGVLLWTQYVVIYLGEDDNFSRFLYHAGRFCFAAVILITTLNFFIPVMFWFDEEGTYHACPARHIQLIFQIILLLLTSIYTMKAIPKVQGDSRNRYKTIFLFGLVVALLLMVQLPYPFLPLYTIGYMLGSCLLHTFVVSNEMDELLQRQSELAIAANRAKSAFLSNMSHEIRTPINSILGMNEMVLRESEDPNILVYAENIRTAGNTLLGIVNDILNFSKIEAARMEIIEVDYDLSSVISDLVNMVRSRADEKGLSLKLSFNPDTPRMLHGDEIRIKQIITNILTNAVKYTEKGSVNFALDFEPLSVSNKGEEERKGEGEGEGKDEGKAEGKDEGKDEGKGDSDSILLDVSISDTGIGIKEEDMKKLFSEFDRIEEKRNRNIEGTGLGMTITKRLLDMMDSRLDVRSVYGEGSTFSFRLRQRVIAWEKLGDYEESHRASILRRKRYHKRFTAPEASVLIVDDNPMNRMVFKGLLKWTRMRIDMAESGDECLKLSSEKRYDIIFLDHMMPVKDGIETLHELRAQDGNPNHDIPVICLTANAISGAREQYISAGFDDYLTKPIDSSRLEEMIMGYLPDEKVKIPDKEADSGADAGADAPEEGAAGEKEDETALAADQNQKISEILQQLLSQDWLNISLGIKNSGNTASYISLLKVFYKSLESNAGEIEEYYASRNWKDYTIKVHSLKSSARLIGAASFGEEAQLLENAGKNDDIGYIQANHAPFMAEYLSFRTPLAEIFSEEPEEGEEKDMPEADLETIKKIYSRIRSAADEMDIEELEGIFSEMDNYSLPESEKSLWRQLKDAAEQYDYDTITRLLSERIIPPAGF